jgi:GTP-binding protein
MISRPLIALIGRPNVGKSTLFNRILGTRNAIVDDVPGVTRDRNYADSDYQGRLFRLVDTGGLDPTATDGMISLIRNQSQIAIAEADILVMVMDGRSGLTPLDQEIVALLRSVKKPIFYAVNKIDTPKSGPLVAEFYRIGIETLYPLSAEHSTGVDDLLEGILPLLPMPDPNEVEGELPPRVAVVGRPNVGKSTLVNALLGEDRVVVSPVAGTTRDPVDSTVVFNGKTYVFTDTAGIRRRGRMDKGIEVYSVARAVKAMGRSDVAVLLLDASEGITEQDTKVSGMALKQGRACVLLVNKWDQTKGDVDAKVKFEADLHRRFPFLAWAPILYGAAIKPESVRKLFPVIDQAYASFTKRISTGPLNQFLQGIIAEQPIPVRKGKPSKEIKSVFMTQVAIRPPSFALFVGRPDNITPTYIKFLENQIRLKYGFEGTPINVLVRQK